MHLGAARAWHGALEGLLWPWELAPTRQAPSPGGRIWHPGCPDHSWCTAAAAGHRASGRPSPRSRHGGRAGGQARSRWCRRCSARRLQSPRSPHRAGSTRGGGPAAVAGRAVKQGPSLCCQPSRQPWQARQCSRGHPSAVSQAGSSNAHTCTAEQLPRPLLSCVGRGLAELCPHRWGVCVPCRAWLQQVKEHGGTCGRITRRAAAACCSCSTTCAAGWPCAGQQVALQAAGCALASTAS